MPDFETVVLTLGSLLAGFVNAIAGGGGLVTLRPAWSLPGFVGVTALTEAPDLVDRGRWDAFCGVRARGCAAAAAAPGSRAAQAESGGLGTTQKDSVSTSACAPAG